MAIVEDDDAVRQALSDLLQVLGLNCSAFDRAEPFLAEYAPGRFNSLITDINMPGVDGLQLQERLRACGSTMPVIFITSVLDALTRARALDGGAHAFLTKPVSDDVLIHHLKSALNWNPDAGDDAGWSQSDV